MELIELTCPMKNQKEFSMKLTVRRVQVQAFVWIRAISGGHFES